MSARDAKLLLEESTGLFVFLPPVNFGYLFLNSSNSMLIAIGGVISLFCSSFIYNYATGYPEESPKYMIVLFGISLVLWLLTLGYTVFRMFEYAESNQSIAVALLLLTVGFVFLLITHYIIGATTEGYDQNY